MIRLEQHASGAWECEGPELRNGPLHGAPGDTLDLAVTSPVGETVTILFRSFYRPPIVRPQPRLKRALRAFRREWSR